MPLNTRFKVNPPEDSAVHAHSPQNPTDLDPEDHDMEPPVAELSMPKAPKMSRFSSPIGNNAPNQNVPGLGIHGSNPMSAIPRPDAPPVTEHWKDVFRIMEGLAPRVGNLRIDLAHDVAQQI